MPTRIVKTPFDQLKAVMEKHWCEPLNGKSTLDDEQLESIKAMAAELPLVDVVEEVPDPPKTDGELLSLAYFECGSNIEKIAAEFLRLRAERDGDAAKSEPLKTVTRCRRAIICTRCGRDADMIPKQKYCGDGNDKDDGHVYQTQLIDEQVVIGAGSDPLEVTAKMINEWEDEYISNDSYENNSWLTVLSARINAHRGVRPVTQVTAEMWEDSDTTYFETDGSAAARAEAAADYINAELAKAGKAGG